MQSSQQPTIAEAKVSGRGNKGGGQGSKRSAFGGSALVRSVGEFAQTSQTTLPSDQDAINQSNEAADATGSREISKYPKPQEQTSTLHSDHTANPSREIEETDRRKPLIHTDKVNTSSRVLYVYSGSPRSLTTNAQQVVNPFIEFPQKADRRVGVLSAMGSDLQLLEVESTKGPQVTPVPRLVVLNLEVGSSTATLTWTLSLFPNPPRRQQQRSATEGFLIRHRRETKELLRPKIAKITLIDESDGTEDESSTGVVAVAAAAASADESDSPADESGEENGLDAQSSTFGQPVTLTRDLKPTKVTDLLRIANESHTSTPRGHSLLVPQEQQENNITATERNITTGNTLDMPVGKRLQLSRVQALPEAVNKRPPVRQMSATITRAAETVTQASSTLAPTTEPASATQAPLASTTPRPRRFKNLGRQRLPSVDQVSSSSTARHVSVHVTEQQTTSSTTTVTPRRSSSMRDESPPVTRAAVRPIYRIPTTATPHSQTSTTTTSTSTTTTSTTTTERPSTTTPPTSTTPSSTSNETEPENFTQVSVGTSIESNPSTPSVLVNDATASEVFREEPMFTEPLSSSTTRAVQFSETPTSQQDIAGLTLAGEAASVSRVEVSPMITNVTVESSSEPTTFEISTTAKPSTVTLQTEPSTASTQARPKQKESQQQQDPSSKWLVRLRRFGSNEVDIVKIVVSNLQTVQLGERQIAFKRLEPASAYEIYIESASPNQQVRDKFHILDANHFLKCQDTSDVELSNSTTSSAVEPNSLRRMDLSQVTSGAGEDDQLTSLPLVSKQPDASEDQEPSKMKSLCKEFFTLPAESHDLVNFGQFESEESRNMRLLGIQNRKQQPSSEQHNATNSTVAATGTASSPRRPKSLGNALKSHMELLEINESGNSNKELSSGTVFEILASRGFLSQQRPASSVTAADSGASNLQVISRVQERPVLQPPLGSVGANQQDYLNLSVLPLVGCVFGLIFLVTLANILLSTINCRSAANQRRRARVGALARAASRRNNTGDSHDHLGSFYSDSDNSATSRSRIMVVGKKVGRSEPFAATSAYFELPANHQIGTTANSRHGSQQSGSSGGAGGNRLSAAGVRFPLGPSFEGDERHNADMVGLARKNYDNFIHHIYNADAPLSQNIDQLDRNSNHLSETGPTSPYSINNRRHSHQQHHHYHHHHHHKRVSGQTNRVSDPQSNAGLLTTVSGSVDQHRQHNSPSPTESGASSTNNRRQRIRFDKINPIYNMDGLQYASPGRSRVAPGAVSSFGHSNQALSPRTCSSESSGSSAEAHEMCPLCQVSDDPNGRAVGERETECSIDSSACDRGSDCNDASSYYTCCLDRQKQRFQKQQQQLEKVVSRNGSLVPRPFINPPEPLSHEESPTYQTRELIMTSGAQSVDSLPNHVADEGSQDTDRLLALEATHQMSDEPANKDHHSTIDKGRKGLRGEQKSFLAFGDVADDLVASPNGTTPQRSSKSMPMPPPPPPPSNPPSGGSTIVKIGAPKSAKNHQSRDETINKTDFNLRRSELASKLHLAGMAKPKS